MWLNIVLVLVVVETQQLQRLFTIQKSKSNNVKMTGIIDTRIAFEDKIQKPTTGAIQIFREACLRYYR